MAVVFVNAMSHLFITANPTNVSGSFTPNGGDAIILFCLSGLSSIPLTSVTGTGTYSIIGTAHTDLNNDSVSYYANSSSTAGAQTVTQNSGGTPGATALYGLEFEYSGVTALGTPVLTTSSSPGTGTGAIQGSSVLVPIGSILVAVAYDSSTSNGTVIATAGTNRGSFTGVGTQEFPWCLQEYAGAGSNITPAFTGNQTTDNYAVLQILLTGNASGVPIIAWTRGS